MKIHYLSALALAGVVALGFSGCGGGGGSRAINGPAGAASFSGTSISFNPTVTFTSDSDFNYVNETGDAGSLSFGGTVAEPLTGTYTYVPDASPRTGTLTLDFTDVTVNEGQPLVLNLSNFQGNKNAIKRFRVLITGVGTYTAQVETGTLVPAGGTGPGDPDDDADVPDGWAGSYHVTYAAANGVTPPANYPFNDGDTRTAVITSGTNGTLNIDGTTLDDPQEVQGSQEIEWQDSTSGLLYRVSFNGGALNDINVYAIANPTQLLGQFSETADPTDPDPEEPDPTDPDPVWDPTTPSTPTGDDGGAPGGNYFLTITDATVQQGTPNTTHTVGENIVIVASSTWASVQPVPASINFNGQTLVFKSYSDNDVITYGQQNEADSEVQVVMDWGVTTGSPIVTFEKAEIYYIDYATVGPRVPVNSTRFTAVPRQAN